MSILMRGSSLFPWFFGAREVRARKVWGPATMLMAGLLTATMIPAVASAQGNPAWQPPIGIPVPAFGITDAASMNPPPRPSPWNASTPGFYYVDRTHPAATDADPRGWPAQPRQTIPNTLAAGSVVELCGLYGRAHSSPNGFRLNGTPSAPVWIRGASPLSCASLPPRAVRAWEVLGSAYFIIENIRFADDLADPTDANLGTVNFYGEDGGGNPAPTSFGAFRHNDVSGNLSDGGIGLGDNSGTVSNIVFWDNVVHDNGDVNANFDQDRHGIAMGANTNNVWVVDNEIARNSGDGMQINGGTGCLTGPPGNATACNTRNIYVGRNYSHNNKQGGLWSKQAQDVIMSQNHLANHVPSNSSPGQCAGFQYAPQRVWFLFNYMHDCTVGIIFASDNGLGFASPQGYVVGNVMHRMKGTAGDVGGGFAFRSAGPRVAVNNTIHDVDIGIDSQSASSSTLTLANNIISNVVTPGSSNNEAILISNSTLANNTTIRNTLFNGSFRVTLGGSTFTSAAALNNGTTRTANISGNPLFANPVPAVLNDFAIQALSPANNAGITDAVYQTFQTLYGIDIRKDIVNNPRVVPYDIGAFEVAGADLSVSLVDSPDPVAHGGQYNYTITVTNNGPVVSDPFTVQLTLPAGASFVSATAGCTQAAGVVTCPRPALAVGTNVVLTVTVTAPAAPGSATATVTVN